MQKQISFTKQATYETYGNLQPTTTTVWLVCHGYGQLAKYFIRRFDCLDPHQHYVIAPQGLSKFYLDEKYEKVGACWLTKEDRTMELENQLHYIDQVWQTEKEQANKIGININELTINILGFSQGCAAACRWSVSRQIPFRNLLVWAGLLPKEITALDWQFLTPDTAVYMLLGRQDEFYQLLNFEEELRRVQTLLPTLRVIYFDGGHEVKREVLANWVATQG